MITAPVLASTRLASALMPWPPPMTMRCTAEAIVKLRTTISSRTGRVPLSCAGHLPLYVRL